MGKRLSGYAVFALFFLIVVKAVRFFVRQPGGGMDCFFLAAFAAFGIFGVAVLVEGGRQSRKAGQRRILSLSILLVLVTGFFLLMDYREYAMLRQVTALLGGAARHGCSCLDGASGQGRRTAF